MKRKTKLIIIVIVIILLVVIFFPKRYVKGGLGGFIMSGDSSYKEEYNCFGLKYSPQETCPDCKTPYYCFGIPYGKKCYIESYYDTNIETSNATKEITDCR